MRTRIEGGRSDLSLYVAPVEPFSDDEGTKRVVGRAGGRRLDEWNMREAVFGYTGELSLHLEPRVAAEGEGKRRKRCRLTTATRSTSFGFVGSCMASADC